MFRVAEFEKVDGKQRFRGFGRGYSLNQFGELFKDGYKVNTTDKRRPGYCEVNFYIGRADNAGNPIYDGDIVTHRGFTGEIEFRKDKAAFLLMLVNGKLRLPYSFLDVYSVALEKKGNKYEKSY